VEIKDRYLNVDNCADNDLITILDSGTEDKNQWGKVKYNFKASNGSYELIYTPDFMAIKELTKAFGRQTDSWVNKQFRVSIVPNLKTKSGKSIFPKPLLI